MHLKSTLRLCASRLLVLPKAKKKGVRKMQIQASKKVCHLTQELQELLRYASISAFHLVQIKLSYSNTATGPVSPLLFSIIAHPHQAAVVSLQVTLSVEDPRNTLPPVPTNMFGRTPLRKGGPRSDVKRQWCCVSQISLATLQQGLSLHCPELL